MEESVSLKQRENVDIKREESVSLKQEENVSIKQRENESLERDESKGVSPGSSLLSDIRTAFPGKKPDVRAYSPLTLAYIGDAVYDLVIRTVVVEQANRPANKLHRITVQYVSAEAQSRIAGALIESFTEEELSVYRRGHNSKPHTMSKNASPADYLKATGFEAVLGYLYLQDKMGRVLELVKKGIQMAELELQEKGNLNN